MRVLDDLLGNSLHSVFLLAVKQTPRYYQTSAGDLKVVPNAKDDPRIAWAGRHARSVTRLTNVLAHCG